MKFDIYCDESCLEALTKKESHPFVGIGGLWLPTEKREETKTSLKEICRRHNINKEFKWNKLSPYYLDFYKEIVDYFFNKEHLRFRAIIIESNKVDNMTFHDSDNELSFYKFYYQLIHHWILDFNHYYIFLDYKLNRNKGRLNELRKVLQYSNLTSTIGLVQGIPSEQSLGIQLADVLLGAVTAKFNNKIKSKAKTGLIEYIEKEYLGKEISPTSKTEEKFNVFRINLLGGW